MKLLRTKYVSPLLLLLAAWQFGQGSYIHVKAQLAQYLIASAWQQTELEHDQVKPWAWADMWPVAKLTVPEHDIEQYVLAGTSGESLAFGPGYVFASSPPLTRGTTVIAAHRDTHFSFLQYLQRGEKITVTTANGKHRDYIVTAMNVVDKSDVTWLDIDVDDYQLSLVTCYPFNAMQVGGDLRYVVQARAVENISI